MPAVCVCVCRSTSTYFRKLNEITLRHFFVSLSLSFLYVLCFSVNYILSEDKRCMEREKLLCKLKYFVMIMRRFGRIEREGETNEYEHDGKEKETQTSRIQEGTH